MADRKGIAGQQSDLSSGLTVAALDGFWERCACWGWPQPSLWLGVAMASVALFAGVEWWVSHWSHSMTLRADAGHLFGDVGALGLALAAAGLAQRLGSLGRVRAAGSHPLEVGAAWVNGLGLVAIALWIGREAWLHLQGPPPTVLTLPMGVTAGLGLLINGVNLYWLHGHCHRDLNLRGAFLHILADFLGSLGAIAAALAVTYGGWVWADAYIGFGVAVLVGGCAVSLLWQCWRRWSSTGLWPSYPDPDPLATLGWCEVGKTDLSRLL